MNRRLRRDDRKFGRRGRIARSQLQKVHDRFGIPKSGSITTDQRAFKRAFAQLIAHCRYTRYSPIYRAVQRLMETLAKTYHATATRV